MCKNVKVYHYAIKIHNGRISVVFGMKFTLRNLLFVTRTDSYGIKNASGKVNKNHKEGQGRVLFEWRYP